MLSEKRAPDKQSTDGKSLLQRIGKSFSDFIGDIVFGMEDGTVSIFGLVFGVASSTSSSSVAFLPLETARLVSLIITATLLLLLGVGRGLVGHRNVVLTALETLGIAAAAALASFLIGKLVTR